MKRLAHFIAGFYPQRWRERYGRELDALIDDAHLTWRDFLDLTTAAAAAHFQPKGADSMLRILELNDRDIPNGYEVESVIESADPAGGAVTTRQFFRELDFGDTYMTIHHWSRGSEPARTFLVTGTKGKVEGDFRADQTEMMELHSDGTFHRSQQTVKTWMKAESIRERLSKHYREGKQAGQSPDQIFQALSDQLK